MRANFDTGEETRSYYGSLCAQRERRDNPTTVGNSTGSSNRARRHGIDYSRHQRERRYFSGNVTAGLCTLCDDYIDIRLRRALRLRDRTDLMENFAAAGMHAFDVRRRIAPEKRDNRHALLDTDRDLFVDRKMQNQIYAERFVGEFANTLKFPPEQWRRRKLRLQNPKPASVTHRGDQLGPGKIRTHRRSNDWMLNADEFAQRRSQHCAINAGCPIPL